MSTLITLENASVTLNTSPVLHDVSWELHSGEHWAVLGRNGAGKSTFLKLLRGEQWPDAPEDNSTPSTRWYSFGSERQFTPIGVRERIGLVSAELQERYIRNDWNLPAETVVLTGFFDSPLLYQAPTSAQRERTRDLLARLGVTHLASRSLLSLSQGEMRKILIARAMAPLEGGPSVLLLDEVLDGLDTSSRRALLDSLDKLAHNAGPNAPLSLVFATHRLAELPCCITHALRFRQGRLIEQGALEAVLSHGAPEQDELTVAGVRPACPLPEQTPDAPTTPLVEMIDADVYINGRPILRDLNWTMRPNENWAVLGANGAGKSTFLKLLKGELYPAYTPPPAGTVRRLGYEHPRSAEETDPGRNLALQRRIGYISPALQAEYEHKLTGEELVWSGFFSSIGLYEPPSQEQKEAATAWISLLGLEHLKQRRVGRLSYGQTRRLLLARAMAAGSLAPPPYLLLLDEPCSGLDKPSRRQFLETLSLLAQSGMRLIYVTHHAHELIPEISHALVLQEGRIISQGPRDDALARSAGL